MTSARKLKECAQTIKISLLKELSLQTVERLNQYKKKCLRKKLLLLRKLKKNNSNNQNYSKKQQQGEMHNKLKRRKCQREKFLKTRQREEAEAETEVKAVTVLAAAKREEEEKRKTSTKAANISKRMISTNKVIRSARGQEVDLEYIYYLNFYKIIIISWVQFLIHLPAAFLFSIMVLMALRLFLRNLGSTPLREAYLCLLGFWIPLLCAFLF